MAHLKGEPKTPGSGRKAGTPNKRTQEVMERLDALGCDPLEGMARIAMDKSAALELRGRMYAELAQYVYPKRKAIAHSGEGGSPLVVKIRKFAN
jgi:hypothetical protein